MYRFDESDPQFLIAHTGNHEPTYADLERTVQRWSAFR